MTSVLGNKKSEKFEYELIPDFVTMSEVYWDENGKIIKVVFRKAEEILLLRPSIKDEENSFSKMMVKV